MQVLSGFTVVFTGKMTKTRAEMESEARRLGARTEERVTRRTHWLVTGARVGRTKTEAAEKVGCKVMTETEYRDEIERRVLESANPPKDDAVVGRTDEFENPKWIEKLKSGRSVAF